GGLSSFKQNHENLCDNSLQLQECREVGGGAPAASVLPQCIPTTPDIENAELTPILPFLFLGNEQDAQDLDAMQRLNIGYVINVTTHLPLYHYEKGLFNYKRLPATDSNKQNLRQYFEEAFEFIEEAHQCGKGLLIHCQAGVSRSATIVIAYLMKHTRMTMTDAYKFVKGKRPIISPNLNFMGQLLEFEEDLNNGVTPRILTPKLMGVETVV
uniref:protein-tyrosine-phosphatase n=1 Tax=Myotis lucifugus TaxID=59463 RepID=G1QFA8_MYOLU